MHKSIKRCDRCRDYFNSEVDLMIDGGEWGFDLVCSPCMRILEGAPYEQGIESPYSWLDLMRYCLPIRVSYGVELLETITQPRWYFIRIGHDIVYQGEDAQAAKGMYSAYSEEEKYKEQYKHTALYRLANGGK
ncbi:hypothetical protein JT351_gp73 [Providencia phage vB_PreS-PibeRecoleta]|uniref:Uncharacterized protein n=1 Tax=Providencia phage vB_PreS-PibeRecoleta TaxID=2761109 RepID=A0A7G5B106_9CAUD|nr:hypothetical protein JT351_gp73 [Providencia phage vB_PreS-PibeRecoleta]QMV29979.1 hypothetical protein [Providencia phage vB_PreS-PibeRecoleta]